MPYLVVKTAANANKSYTLTNTCNKPRLAVRLSNGNTSYVALSQVNTTGVKVRGSNGVTYALVDKKDVYSYTIDRSTTVQSTTQTTLMNINMSYTGIVQNKFLAYRTGTSTRRSTSRTESETYSVVRNAVESIASFTFTNFIIEVYNNSSSIFSQYVFSFSSLTNCIVYTNSSSVRNKYSFELRAQSSLERYQTLDLYSYPRFYYSNNTYTLSKEIETNYKLTRTERSVSLKTTRLTYRNAASSYTSYTETHSVSMNYELSTTDSYYSLDAISRLNFTSTAIYTPGSNETIISSLSG